MTRRKKISLSAIVLLLLIGICWWAFGRESAQLRKVRLLMKDMGPPGARRGPPSAEDRAKFDSMRKEMDKLSESERQKLFGGFHQDMQKRMTNDLNNYFAMSKEQRLALMSERVKDMEQRRKEMEENRDKSKTGPGGGPGGPGGGPGGPGGGPPPGGKPSFSQMHAFHTQMMSHVPPVMRAQMSAMHADMRQQRLAAGLSADPEPPHRPK